MSSEIYYFSGTGNSLAVARNLAERINGRLLSIPSLIDDQSIACNADAIALVFPVYHKDIPLVIKRFVEKLENLENKYVFAVYTYGGTPGLGVGRLRRLIAARGGNLAAGFGVHMPYNYLTPTLALRGFYSSFTLREIPLETQHSLLSQVDKRLDSIAAFVGAGESGTFEESSDVLTRLAHRLNLPESLGKTTWLKVGGVYESIDLPFMESRQLMDRAFRVNGKCTGCGICASVCPVGNIRMAEERPVWQHHCEQCFACLHWCPKEAVQFGTKTAGKRRYHHPDVTLADMVRQRRPAGDGTVTASSIV